MKKYKDVEKTITQRELVELRCDLCGTPGDNYGDWQTDCYKQNDTDVELTVTVKHRDVECYPEDLPNGEEIEFHICPKCFREKLVPWLQSQGAEATYRNVGLGK